MQYRHAKPCQKQTSCIARHLKRSKLRVPTSQLLFQANAKYPSNSHGWGSAMLRRGPCLLPLKLRGNKVTQIDYGPSASPVAMQCKNVYIQLARKDLLVHMHKCEASITWPTKHKKFRVLSDKSRNSLPAFTGCLSL